MCKRKIGRLKVVEIMLKKLIKILVFKIMLLFN